jgi:hypothetical protein
LFHSFVESLLPARATALLPERSFLAPVPLDVIQKHGSASGPGNRWTRPENFVGNGPFVLKSWRAGQKLVVARSPTYWDHARVKLDEIHFHPADNPIVEERMFRTGQLHITQTLPISKIATYRGDVPAALHIDPYGGLYYYLFNVKRAPFTDVRVRRAFSLHLAEIFRGDGALPPRSPRTPGRGRPGSTGQYVLRPATGRVMDTGNSGGKGARFGEDARDVPIGVFEPLAFTATPWV